MFGDNTQMACEGGDQHAGCAGFTDHDTPVRQRVARIEGSTDVEVLPPGGSTVFSIRYPDGTCLHRPYRLELRLPGSDQPLDVLRTSVCAQDPVGVTPIGLVAHAYADAG